MTKEKLTITSNQEEIVFGSLQEARCAFHQLLMNRDVLFSQLKKAINTTDPLVKMQVKSRWKALAEMEEYLFTFKCKMKILEGKEEPKSTIDSSNITERTEVAPLSEDVCAVSEPVVEPKEN